MFSIVSLPVLGLHFVNHPSLLGLQLQIHEFFQVESSVINCCNNIYFLCGQLLWGINANPNVFVSIRLLSCSSKVVSFCLLSEIEILSCFVHADVIFGIASLKLDLSASVLLCYFDFVILCSVSESYPPSLKSVCTDMHIKNVNYFIKI